MNYMKKYIIVMGAVALLGLGMTARAEQVAPAGHSIDVSIGDWDDDQKLTFDFQDLPSASFTGLRLHLSCGLKGARILYTTNVLATPADAEAWTVYTEPIYLTADCTVRFFARAEGYDDSEIQQFDFVYADYQTAAPTLAPDMERTHMVMVCDTPGAEIRYSTDGSEPLSTSALYEAPVLIEANGTFRARAFAADMFDSEITDYVVDYLTTATPEAAFVNKALVLSCADEKAAIYYTTDADASIENSDAWTLYEAPVALTADCTVRFFARHTGYHDSGVQSFAFAYSAYQASAPVITADAEGTHVIMTSETEDAEIRYTTDGSEPTAESTLYTAPVEIMANGVFRARAFRDDMFESNISEYSVNHLAVPVPTAVFENKMLVLACSDSKAEILYTAEADAAVENSEAWMVYTSPVALTENCTIRFYGRREGYNNSDVQSFAFVYSTYQVATPAVMRNDEGTHIVMTTATEGAEIRYTTDGSEPTAESTLYTAPVLIVSNGMFRARAFADGLFDSEIIDYYVNDSSVPAPSAAIENKMLVLTCSDAEALIYYTTDAEATPADMDAWILYSAPVEMNEDCTIHFFARRENFNDSDIETFVFQRANYQAAAPVIDRSADGRSIVMITETDGAEIRYTTDGSEPTADSELYTEPVFITMNCTFRARAYAEGLFESAVSEFTVANMTMMMPHATFENKLLTLAVWDEQASIWFTTDVDAAHDDAEAWTLYTEPIALTEDCTVRFFARRGGFLDSQIASFEFVYADHQVAAPVIAYDAANYIVTIECETYGAEIRYTTDGSEPTADSELYTGPIAVSSPMLVRARAFADNLFDSEISECEVDYTSGIDNIAAGGASLRIFSDGADLVVVSDRATTLPVYNVSGSLVCLLNIESGRTTIPNLARGVYIIAGIKVLH